MGDLTKAVTDAAQAHTNLSMFHAIISLAESGCFYGYHRELDQIVNICKRAAGRQLRLHDAAVEAAAGRSDLKDTGRELRQTIRNPQCADQEGRSSDAGADLSGEGFGQTNVEKQCADEGPQPRSPQEPSR